MNRLLIAAAFISSVTVTQFAAAADLPTKAPPAPVAPLPTWTGFYIGGHGGLGWTSADGRWDPLPSQQFFNAFGQQGDFNDTAFIGGAQAGYNWQFAPTWVAGIEADWSWTNAKGGFGEGWRQAFNGAPIPNSLTNLNMSLNWLATVRGRIGYLFTPQALAYFTGGVAWGHIDYSAQATSPEYNAATSFSDTSVGYVLGGGVEWMFANHWMLRGEYLFYHLDSGKSVDGTFRSFAGATSAFTWDDLKVNVVRTALSYKF
jgi:outer membrane immunogenic protein